MGAFPLSERKGSDDERDGNVGHVIQCGWIQAGGDAGFRRYCARAGTSTRLAPHPALRHRILISLLNAGVLAPVASRRRLDDAVSEAHWADTSLEDADWAIVWDDVTRGSLPTRLRHYLDDFGSTARTREVLLETWQALAIDATPAGCATRQT